MKVTIITATYNSASSIQSCLDSVVKQDYTNLEYLIIDGKSNDLTLEIVKSYQKRYSYIKIVSEADFGIYDALNKGIINATGELVGFVHSDDILNSSTIISELIQKVSLENLDGVYGDLQYVDKVDTNKVIRYWKSREFESHLLKTGWMPAHPSLFLTKKVYEKHGFFDLSYSISADYDFMLRILKDKSLKFSYLPKVITKMRVGGASNRSVKNILKKSKEDYRAIRKNKIGNLFTLIRKNTSKIKQFIN